MKNDDLLDLDFTDMPSSFSIDRRQFMKLGGGIVLFFTISDLDLLAQQRQGRSLPTDVNAFLKIGEDGRVSCFTGKIEMGQGVITSLGQMLADEMDVPLEAVDMVMGDTDICPWDMGTFGSLSTRMFGPALRNAGAEARLILVELAVERLKVAADRLITADGFVMEKANTANRVSYADLAKGRRIERKSTGKAVVKKPAEFRIMGKSLNRRDAKEKVTGKAKYAADIRLPGMLYAKILRPPAHGAKLISADVTEANRIDGVQVFRDGEFVAVLHKYPDIAEFALSRVKAAYDKPKTGIDDKTIFDHLLKVAPDPRSVASGGDLQKGASDSSIAVEAVYYNDYVAHSPIEPHAAAVKIDGGKATVWASTQNPFTAKEEVARELGFAPENVRIVPPFVGGGFGGKTNNRQAVEAAKLAKLSGVPVQVAWTRKEEFFYDTFRPAAVVKIRSGVNSGGLLTLWDYNVYFAGSRGSEHFYNIPNHSTKAFNASWTGAPGSHPFATGPWRAPANNTNTFARESQVDIMAARSGVDPVEFRLRNLTDKKMRNVLEAAAKKFGWKPDAAPSGRGFGVACGIDAGTSVATMVEVEVDRSTGDVRVKRVVCAQDMGLVVNPEGATIQMEGCITMGLGYALKEGIRFKDGEIFDVNFDSYDIPKFSWVPKIETVIIDNQEADPQGGGEPAIVTMGGAIANAIFDAVGARLYQLPMTPERILGAMKK